MNTLETKVRERVVAARALDDRNYQIYLVVRKVIKDMDGQKMTKRVANAVERELPDHTVYYKRDKVNGHVMGCYIYVWGGGIDCNKRLSFALGSQDNVDLARFDDASRCYGSAAKERIDECDEFLQDNERIAKIVSAYCMLADAQRNWDEVIERHGCDAAKYDIEKALGIGSEG